MLAEQSKYKHKWHKWVIVTTDQGFAMMVVHEGVCNNYNNSHESPLLCLVLRLSKVEVTHIIYGFFMK